MKDTEYGLVQRTTNKYICFKIEFTDDFNKLLLSKTLSENEFKEFDDITNFVNF